MACNHRISPGEDWLPSRWEELVEGDAIVDLHEWSSNRGERPLTVHRCGFTAALWDSLANAGESDGFDQRILVVLGAALSSLGATLARDPESGCSRRVTLHFRAPMRAGRDAPKRFLLELQAEVECAEPRSVVIGFAASTTIAAAGREVGWKTALVVLLCTLIGCIAVAGEEHAPRSGAFDGVYEGFIEARCPSGWSERRLQLTVTRDLGAFVCTTCEVRRLTVVHVTAEGRVVFPSSMGVETEADLDPTRVLGAAPVACLVGDTVVAQPLGQFGLVRAQDAPLHLDPETERLSAAEGATNLGSLAAP